MRNLYNKLFWLTASLFVWAACVDDYTEYNGVHALDAPTLRVSASGANQSLLAVPVNQYQKSFNAYVGLGTPVEFTISVIDAPGKVSSVSVTPSVPEFGTVTLDEASVTALKGKEIGDFRFVYTPNPNLVEGDDRPLNIVVTVTDGQEGDNSKTTTLSIATIVGSPCFSQTLKVGNYLVTQASGNRDGGIPYTLDSLQLALRSRVVVSIAEERPGVYTMTEVTGGVWPVYYSGRAVPELQVNVCGNTITSRTGYATTSPGTAVARTFAINGTVNNDNTVDITWSYVRDDGATPIDPAKGSYKLNLIRLGM